MPGIAIYTHIQRALHTKLKAPLPSVAIRSYCVSTVYRYTCTSTGTRVRTMVHVYVHVYHTYTWPQQPSTNPVNHVQIEAVGVYWWYALRFLARGSFVSSVGNANTLAEQSFARRNADHRINSPLHRTASSICSFYCGVFFSLCKEAIYPGRD